jgi:hypothetical protein
MDGSRFDALTQRLGSIRLTRKGAVRGLVGGVVALTGGAAFTDGVKAGKKKPICHCGEAGSTSCTDERVSKKQRKAHLRDHQCDYLGACRSDINACAAAPIVINIDRLGTPCSNNNPCGANSGLRCVANICVPIDLGDSCTNDGECSTGRCEGSVCVECPLLSICGTTNTPQCCTVSASCDLTDDVCALP